MRKFSNAVGFALVLSLPAIVAATVFATFAAYI